MRRATVGAAPNRATQIDNSLVKSAVATEKRSDRTTSVVAWLQKPGLAHTDASGCLNNGNGIESIIQPISYRLQRFENYTKESPMARFRLLISIRNPFAASIFLIRIRSKVPFHFASKEPLKITEISASPLTRTRILALLVHPPAFEAPFCKTSPNVRETVNLKLSKEKSVQKRIKQRILVPFVNAPRNCSTWNTIDHSSESALRSRPYGRKSSRSMKAIFPYASTVSERHSERLYRQE